MEKFIRAGDGTLLELYRDMRMNDQEFISKLLELTHTKKAVLLGLETQGTYEEVKEKEKKRERCDFLDQIVATRYRNFTKKDRVKECIM